MRLYILSVFTINCLKKVSYQLELYTLSVHKLKKAPKILYFNNKKKTRKDN